jgi:tRNA/tmRNA/rRNA uracil-C5-methylase (TrmA/RlmC/RlmD family)
LLGNIAKKNSTVVSNENEKFQNGEVAPDHPKLAEGERLTSLDLYCGAGLFSRGLLESGLVKPGWGVDSSKDCTDTFKANFPEAFALHMTVDDLLQHLSRVNILLAKINSQLN